MANEEHLEVLKQGVEVWNRWREENPNILPDLSGVDLNETDLRGMNLRRVDLHGTTLIKANLAGANLTEANLFWAEPGLADLSGADLTQACLFQAYLAKTDLTATNLDRADLTGAILTDAIFHHADISRVNLTGAELTNTDFSGAVVGGVVFGDNDLSTVRKLDTVFHNVPSTIGIDTIYRSKGKTPEVFLRGCGLSDWEIEFSKLYQEGLSSNEIATILYRIHDLRAGRSIQVSPLFISYSHADSAFVDVMEEFLNQKGIRFWRDIHHATAGRLEKQIDHAIRHNPTVLLTLSKNSVNSDWVQHEARLARKLEIETGRDVLCPVALDDSWKTCRWPERLWEQIMEYNILDFSDWEYEGAFEGMFDRLIDGLDLFYE